MQTVIMGNQILRVQQMPQIVTAASGNRLTTNVMNNKIVNSSETGSTTTNIAGPKTIFLGSSGQTLRLQPASGAIQTAQVSSKNIIVNTNQQVSYALITNYMYSKPNKKISVWWAYLGVFVCFLLEFVRMLKAPKDISFESRSYCRTVTNDLHLYI